MVRSGQRRSGKEKGTVEKSQSTNVPRDAEFVWIDCPYPVMALGLAQILEAEMRVYVGRERPREVPSLVVLCSDDTGELSQSVRRIGDTNPRAPVLVFGTRLDIPLARYALKVGARGFIHAGMKPEQITRAISVAMEGKLAAPRRLLEYLLTNEEATFETLSSRQREVLELVGDGLSNAQIAKRLFLTESTVKQHLRAAYKVLGVKNRSEAVRVLHNNGD